MAPPSAKSPSLSSCVNSVLLHTEASAAMFQQHSFSKSLPPVTPPGFVQKPGPGQLSPTAFLTRPAPHSGSPPILSPHTTRLAGHTTPEQSPDAHSPSQLDRLPSPSCVECSTSWLLFKEKFTCGVLGSGVSPCVPASTKPHCW